MKYYEDNYITEITNDKDTAIVFFKSKDIKDFKNKTGELAEWNEFQCHYTALVRTTEFDDGSKQYLIFPLIYYNYKQKVSSASISFDMKDVAKAGEEIHESSITIYKALKKELKEKYDINKNGKVSYMMTMFNTIHKHP